MDDDVRSVWEHTLDALAADTSSRATIEALEIPLLEHAHRASWRVLTAEAAALYATTLAEHSAALWPDVRDRLERGSRVLATEVAKARHLAACLRADLGRVFTQVDVLVIPTMPRVTPSRAVAPPRVPTSGEETVPVDGEFVPLGQATTRLTSAWNLVGVPAGSVPAGVDSGGAPVGVQVIGPWRGELTVLNVMAAIERLTDGHAVQEIG